MAEIVYILCALTSLACTVLLFQGYRASGVRLLFWSSLCFAGLMLNNVLLLVDIMIFPTIDLSLARTLPALIGLMLLLYGLIWDAK